MGGGAVLSYAGLDRQAETLADRLRTEGVGPDVRVGLCIERSPALVVGMLGILKAGGAYVPIDPSTPEARTRFMLADSGARVLVTSQGLRDQVAAFDVPTVCLDEDALRSGFPDRRGVPDESLAYVIYTSGTTGRPKGVMVEHASALRLMEAMRQRLGVTERDTVLGITTPAFDLSVPDFFLPLTTGACLRLATAAEAADPDRLAALVDEASLLQATPATWRMLIDAGWKGNPALTMVSGGDALSGDLAQALIERGKALWNFYGPTETTVWATCQRVTADAPVSLGEPFPGVDLSLCDERQSPVADGEAGEIYIGGWGLARGYLGRPDLTADRFVTIGGQRMYRTGDLARRDADGALRFLGRGDTQVKVRGFRIELGEIESVLTAHSSVAECVVLAREDRPGDVRLVAYLVGDGEPDVEALRHHLAERLPDYMIPSAYVGLDAFPLTPRKKVDRSALPSPPEAEVHGTPRTETERELGALWQDALSVSSVGPDDGFAELGGHSLLAVRLIAKIRRRWDIALDLPAVFHHPTLRALAAEIDRRRVAPREGPRLTRTDRQRGAPSFAQERLWFLDRLHPESALYTIAEAFRLKGPLDAGALQVALDRLVERHDVLRTRLVQTESGAPEQVVESHAHVPLTHLDGDLADLDGLLLREARRPFRLSDDLPLRAVLVRLGEEDHALLLALHHAVADGWSLPVVYGDLAALYREARGGATSMWDDDSPRYIDYARWQREHLDGPEGESQLRYWRDALVGAETVLRLPGGHTRTHVVSDAGARLSMEYHPGLGAALDAFCRREGVTPFVASLTVYSGLLAHLADQSDLIVGVNTSSRARFGAEEAVGLYVNMVPVRAQLDLSESWRSALTVVSDAALGAFAQAEVPFEWVVDAVGGKRRPGVAPLVQTVFSLQDAHDRRLPLLAIEATPLDLDLGTAKFDLVMDLVRDGDGLRGVLEFSTDVPASTAQALLAQYGAALNHLLADPDAPLASLHGALVEAKLARSPGPREVDASLAVSDADRAALDIFAMSAEAPDSEHATLHAYVEAQAARTPDASAVVGPDGCLTYRDLDSRANRLARLLQSLGVGPEQRVAILLDRSAEVVVAILATLKAGGAYVPIDPTYPAERIAFMLDDADVTAVITRSSLDVERPEAVVPLIDLDRDSESIAAFSADWARGGAEAGSAAYVIYTSGSTGRPKGVVVEHQHAVASTVARFAVYEEPVGAYLLVPSFAFDSSVAGLFWTLATGGTIVIPAPNEAGDPRALVALAETNSVTHLLAVPSLYGLLLDTDRERLASLRVCIVAGEACPPGLIDRHRQRLPAARLFNEYGPTEAAVWSTVYDTAGWDDDREQSQTLPIGRPIPGAWIWLLDEDGRRVPPGASGEICVGGPGVARGYLGQPGLTVERFIEDSGGRRLYRTGDLGRYLPNGALQFLGRTDSQIKLRGYRIELGEIEAVLSEHERVGEAAVALRDDATGEPRLVAYVVPPATAAVDPTHRLSSGSGDGAPPLGTRLEPRPLRAWVRTHSNVIRDEGANLAEIEASDWPTIREVTMEVQDTTDALSRVRETLVGHGFHVAEEPGAERDGTRFVKVYAVRDDASNTERQPFSPVFPAWREPEALAEALRSFARDRLPSYMVPDSVLLVGSMPRTPNGKLDRDALPDPPAPDVEVAEMYTAPTTDTERRLAAIWATVLGVDRVGIHDDFFDRGGHSLLAIKLFAHIERAFGEAPPLASLFSAPTVARLAPLVEEIVRAGEEDALGSALVPLQPAGDRPPIFCIHTAYNELLVYHPLARRLAPDQPVYYMRGEGHDGRPITRTTIDEMARYYADQIRSAHPDGPYLLLGYCIGGRLAMEVARHLERTGGRVALLAVVETPLGPPLPTRAEKYLGALRALRERGLEVAREFDPRTAGRWVQTHAAHWFRRAYRSWAAPVVERLAERGGTIPESARQPYIKESYLRILYDHEMTPYAGRLLLIRSTRSDDLHANWKSLAVEDYDEVALDAYRLLHEPAVEEVAEHIRAHVGRALGAS